MCLESSLIHCYAANLPVALIRLLLCNGAVKRTQTHRIRFDYIYSMASIIHVKEQDRERLYKRFEKRKNAEGIIRIPKEYGMFISVKP